MINIIRSGGFFTPFHRFSPFFTVKTHTRAYKLTCKVGHFDYSMVKQNSSLLIDMIIKQSKREATLV